VRRLYRSHFQAEKTQTITVVENLLPLILKVLLLNKSLLTYCSNTDTVTNIRIRPSLAKGRGIKGRGRQSKQQQCGS